MYNMKNTIYGNEWSRPFITLIIMLTGLFFSQTGYSQYTSPKDSLGGAQVPPEIENPELLGINKEPAHATLMPYSSLNEALATNRHASTFCRNVEIQLGCVATDATG
jgi:hypothetical protein